MTKDGDFLVDYSKNILTEEALKKLFDVVNMLFLIVNRPKTFQIFFSVANNFGIIIQ